MLKKGIYPQRYKLLREKTRSREGERASPLGSQLSFKGREYVASFSSREHGETHRDTGLFSPTAVIQSLLAKKTQQLDLSI